MGLGMVSEYSRSRIPNPPQNNTTFMRVSLAPCALRENYSSRGNCGLWAVVQHLRSRTSQVASPVARGEILRVLGIAAHCSDASAIPEALFTIMGDPGRPTSGQLGTRSEIAVTPNAVECRTPDRQTERHALRFVCKRQRSCNTSLYFPQESGIHARSARAHTTFDRLSCLAPCHTFHS